VQAQALLIATYAMLQIAGPVERQTAS
jgi:hypothetical protein